MKLLRLRPFEFGAQEMVKATLLVCLSLVLLLYVNCGKIPHFDLAEQAVGTFHEQYNKEEYQAIYDQADPEFRAAIDMNGFLNMMQELHRVLGNRVKADSVRIDVRYGTDGTKIELQYNTEFAKGHAAEIFIWRLSSDKAILVRYDLATSKKQ